jgi:heptosyltransferase II
MKTLIIKNGASGDVVRTTTLLNILTGEIDWITTKMNSVLLEGDSRVNRIIFNDKAKEFNFPEYDLVINLEDTVEEAELLKKIKYKELFGAYLNSANEMSYTDNSSEWFDLSLISKYGLERANELKYQNNRSFQELIFKGLGFDFKGEPYYLPKSPVTDLSGDIAISPKAGKVWPMKNWAYYDELAEFLRAKGYIVNFLPQRDTMLEHLSDVRNHKYLISGDSLPMHFALGSNIPCLTIFICTSPTEIYDYGVMKKIISPGLEKYFYRRDFNQAAVESISLNEVINEFNLLKKSGE